MMNKLHCLCRDCGNPLEHRLTVTETYEGTLLDVAIIPCRFCIQKAVDEAEDEVERRFAELQAGEDL